MDSPERVADRAGVVGGATLASRVLGFARDAVLANRFQVGQTDAFFVAFMIPNLLRRLVGEGSLTAAFVPVFTGWAQRSAADGRKLFNATWTLGALVGLILTVAGIAFADELIGLFAPGFVGPKRELATHLLRLCFPYIFFMILLAVAMGALNASGHFLWPALAPVLLNLTLIAGAFAGPAWLQQPILALGYAAVIAGALQVALQIPALVRRQLSPAPVIAPRHPGIRRLGVLMLPAVLGASVFQLNLLVNRFLASFQDDGAVSYLYYADRLLELPLGVFVLALGTASLPSFARLAKARDDDGLKRSFSSTLSLALALAAPSALGLIILREDVFRALFRWDPEVFTERAVSGCAAALFFYALGLVPITVSRIFVNLCVAHENTATGARGAVVSLLTNVLISLALVGPLPANAGLPSWFVSAQNTWVLYDLDFRGLALAASLASAANAVYVAGSARRRYGKLLSGADVASWLRIGAATLLMVGAVSWLRAFLPLPDAASLGALALLSLYVGVGALVYAVVLLGLRGPEFGLLLGLLPRRKPTAPGGGFRSGR